MATYGRTTVTSLFSTNSDFSPPNKPETYSFDVTSPTKILQQRLVIVAATGTQTIDLGLFTTISYMLVQNESTSGGYVSALFDTAGTAGGAALRTRIGDWSKYTDVAGGSDDVVFTAETGTCYVNVTIVGTA